MVQLNSDLLLFLDLGCDHCNLVVVVVLHDGRLNIGGLFEFLHKNEVQLNNITMGGSPGLVVKERDL